VPTCLRARLGSAAEDRPSTASADGDLLNTLRDELKMILAVCGPGRVCDCRILQALADDT